MVFQGSLKDVSMKYQKCFMQVSWKDSFKGIIIRDRQNFGLNLVIIEIKSMYNFLILFSEHIINHFKKPIKSNIPKVLE